jgi:hypothetical protein
LEYGNKLGEPISSFMRTARPFKHNHFKIGDRVRLSDLGRQRCPEMPVAVATVVALSRNSTAVQVQFSERRTPMTLHVTYLERVGPEAAI